MVCVVVVVVLKIAMTTPTQSQTQFKSKHKQNNSHLFTGVFLKSTICSKRAKFSSIFTSGRMLCSIVLMYHDNDISTPGNHLLIFGLFFLFLSFSHPFRLRISKHTSSVRRKENEIEIKR